MFKKHAFYIGIDAGVTTGFAMWDRKSKKLIQVQSVMIHQAMQMVVDAVRGLEECAAHTKEPPDTILVRVEDARLRVENFYGKAGPAKLQGVGSVKRDAKIWEDFLTDYKIPFELVHPKNNKTKVTQEYFKKVTGWQDKTNEHSRDAGMLVFGM